MSPIPETKNIKDFNRSDNILVYFLICLTALSSFLSIFGSQTFGVYFYWSILGLLFSFYLLSNRYWQSFLVLTTALATLPIFQAGVIVGFRTWYYITIITAVFLSFRLKMGYFSMPGFKWWFLLLLLGMFDLLFAQSSAGFNYSRGALIQIVAGLSAFAIAYQVSRLRDYREAISQLSFLIMAVCTLSLLVPLLISQSIGTDESMRLGEEMSMDANGIGTTSIYAFVAMLFYVLDEKRILKAPIIIIVIGLFIVAIVKSGSRSNIITGVLTLGLFLIMTFRQKFKRYHLIILISMFLSVAYLIGAKQLAYVEDRFTTAYDSVGGRGIDRINHLLISLYMVADHPLGLGGGGFVDNFNQYKGQAGVVTFARAPSPHTLFGMVIADWGIPGILLLLGGFVAIARSILRSKGLSRTVKALALCAYLILANAGMSFPPIFMSLLGITDQGKMNEADEASDAKRDHYQ